MSDTIRALVPELQPLFDRQRWRTVRESLSLLYVSMTRAIHGLYMIIDAPRNNEKTMPKTFAGVLRCALADGRADPGETLFEEGDPEWMTSIISTPRRATPARQSGTPIALAKPLHSHTRGLAAKAASMLHGDDDDGRLDLKLSDDESRQRGTAIHSLFEQIEWIEEFQIDDTSLSRMMSARIARRDQKWITQRIAAFRTMLAHKSVRNAFSRKAIPHTVPSRADVYREFPFVRLVDGRVQQGSIDRLVVFRNSTGAAMSANVIDFKTDAIDAKDSPAQAEHYRPQLQTYRAVAADWLGLDESRVSMSVIFVAMGAVIPLT